ncbi:AP-1 complex subunit beta-1, partial [Stegodyphus mimosarum]
MEMTFFNKAMQAMGGFAIQFNKNSFGLAPAQPLQVPAPLLPNTSADVSLLLNTMGAVQKMDPLTNLQVAVKNNVDVFYFSTVVPLHVFCTEDGMMDKRVFLATWKDIPAQNEVQYTIDNIVLSTDQVSQKLQNNNIFTIAKRNVDGQDMLYQSLKLTNGIWVLAEMKIQPGVTSFTLSLKSRAMDVASSVHQAYEAILHN